MSAQAKSAEKRVSQSNEAKRATLEMLTGKKPRRDEFTAPLGQDGEEVSFLFTAIGSKKYDAMLTKHPPTMEQRADGAAFNGDTFAPALLAAVCTDPAIDVKTWSQIWESDNWARGEVSALFWRAVRLCTQEVDINPTGAG